MTGIHRARSIDLIVTVLFLGMALSSSGCVSTTLQLAEHHPGRPDSTAGAAATDVAAILRPDAALYQTVEAKGKEASLATPDGTRAKPYLGRGTIREVADESLLIAHEAIPGFMGAMTMAYSLSKEVDTKGLVAGDVVTFAIEVPKSGGHQVFNIQKVEIGKAEGAKHEHD